MAIKGREVLSDDGTQVVIRVGAGESWHDFVVWCHHQGFHGLANLALIPGSVGGAPIQNIGAYGVEVAERIEAVHVVHRHTGERACLSRDDCEFRYRDSVFKHSAGVQWIITEVDFVLDREAVVEANYPTLRARLSEAELTHDAVLAAVISIRRERLPDPVITPNVGSFFKNPVISQQDIDILRQNFPEIPVYPASGDAVKISAAWLIDQLGWRGEERDGVKVSDDHALVLEGCGARSAAPWLALAEDIAASVREAYDVSLELEPRVIGATE
jgi:UDP-N-acetylmuramate dehydrogenase